MITFNSTKNAEQYYYPGSGGIWHPTEVLECLEFSKKPEYDKV